MTTTVTSSRPLGRYHGGKWRLAPWILRQFPPHRVYCESYAGFGSVLIRKSRSYSEVLNDTNGEVVNLFRVLRDPTTRAALVDAVRWTPYARAAFVDSYEPATDPVEQARRTLVRAAMGYSTASQARIRTGFRGNVTRRGSTPAHDWAGMPPVLAAIGERLRGVVIEQDDALTVMQRYDSLETLHYLDPPYLGSTRAARHAGMAYTHDMADEAQHRAMIAVARRLRGHVVISGYPSELYAELLGDWMCVQRLARADGAGVRMEVLWIRPMTGEGN